MYALLAATEPDLKVLPGKDELIFGSIAFLILVAVMVKFVFPKLKDGLAKRAAAIQGKLEDAERTRRDADDLLEQYRRQLAEARADVQKIIDEGKRTADALRTDLVAKAEQEAAEIVSRARADVAGERDRVVSELKSSLGELSVKLAGQVIERELSSTDVHRQLVDKAIAELAAGSRN